MLVEVSVAVNYILSHLYTKLPRRRVDSFGEELERYLIAKFQHHWFPNDPLRDAAYRCLNSSGPQVDLLLPEAAAVSGLDWSEIQACLPEGLVLSVDPGHVACRHNQPNSTVNDVNRFATSNLWPSASLSLSSSGCSSASSSISSSNPASNSAQVTHQVLYSSQDGWGSCSNYLWNEQQNETAISKTARLDGDHGDNLATAAALSVLIDPDEGIDTRLSQELLHGGSPALINQTPWANDLTGLASPGNGNQTSRAFHDIDLKNIEFLKSDLVNGCDTSTVTNSVPWTIAEDTNDNTLLNILGCDSNGTTGMAQSSLITQRTQTFPGFHRSSSNPPQSEQLSVLNLGDYLPIHSAHMNGSSITPSLTTKLDQSLNSVLPSASARPFPNYLQPVPVLTTTSNHPFVQKSTSTPSFTAATFAQTKFGSTKLKTHTKRTPTRILSPTTVPQNFNAANGNGMLQNDGTSASISGANQRINTTNPNSISAFRRFLPLSVDLNSHKPNGCSNPTESVFQPECNSIKHQDNGHSPSDLTLPAFQIRSLQMNGLEDYLTHANEETISSDIFARFGASEDQTNPHVANLWNSYNVRQIPDETENIETLETPSGPDATLCQGWPDGLMGPTVNTTGLTSAMLTGNALNNLNLESIKSNRLALNQSAVRFEDHNDGLLDDATLSTRMVNLLLEEDSSVDSSANHTAPTKPNLIEEQEGGETNHNSNRSTSDLKSVSQPNIFSDKDSNLDLNPVQKSNFVQSDPANKNSNHSLTNLMIPESFGSF